jgi:hypothetical protein
MKIGIDAVLGVTSHRLPRLLKPVFYDDYGDQYKTRPVQTIPGPKDAAKIGPRESRCF